jgi:hypothetical protein
MPATALAVDGITDGNQLRLNAAALGIERNAEFQGELITVDNSPEHIRFGELTFRVVGPSLENLVNLRDAWLEWLEETEEALGEDPALAEMTDHSIPNLSSIMLLAEMQGRRILLTGDGRGDHLMQGLDQADLLDASGRLHLDIFKIPHHGSHRNVTRDLFRKITADRYVVSADGRYGNPDLSTFIWMAEAARDQGREIEIFATNETPASRKFQQEYPAEEYGYVLTHMTSNVNSAGISLES